jgi:hypothetical protein
MNPHFLFHVSAVVRASVPRLNLDDVFEQKFDIAKAVEQELEKVHFLSTDHGCFSRLIWSKLFCLLGGQNYRALKCLIYLNDIFQAMTAYGYEIVQTLIVDIVPDITVKKAMNEINAGMSI